jgi:hypothetical protein
MLSVVMLNVIMLSVVALISGLVGKIILDLLDGHPYQRDNLQPVPCL